MKNPFRYRSYYYDFETNLYYLNSRYYDPETGRFVNADDIAILNSTKEVLNGLNLYTYCLNNPVKYSDSNGNFLDTYPEIIDFLSAFFETAIGLGLGALGFAIKFAAKPNNIGVGIFNKIKANQLKNISKASKIISKISTGIAIISVVLNVIEGVIHDIKNDYSVDRIISNAVTNTLVYGGTTLAAGFIGGEIGALIGSVVPGLGTAIGAAVGFAVGITFSWLFEIKINGKSIINHIRDGLYSFWRWLFG